MSNTVQYRGNANSIDQFLADKLQSTNRPRWTAQWSRVRDSRLEKGVEVLNDCYTRPPSRQPTGATPGYDLSVPNQLVSVE